MRRWTALLGVVVMLGVAPCASGFDGARKGFILGGGLGFGSVSFKQEIDYSFPAGASYRAARSRAVLDTPTESKQGVVSDFKIGAGLTDQVLLYYASHVSWFSIKNVFGNDVTIANGAGGAGIMYFTKPSAPCFCVHGGIGFSTWGTPFEEGGSTSSGFGMWAGGGYEFSPHWIIEATLAHGRPSDTERGVKLETRATSVGITVNYLAY